MVLQCHCKNAFQDDKYGVNMRVHNWAVKKEVWRCTVCLHEKQDLSKAKKEKEKAKK